MGGKPKVSKAPPPPAPVVMPLPDDDAIEAAKKRKIVQIQQGSGRSSTDLTGGNTGADVLGT